uniref:C2H2-type domain-containing protein n=1 Tax=Fagus sylvatica TaxID=28930 RepID=A0A2N9F9A5_FAGSY
MLCGSYTIFPNSEPSSPNGQQFVSCKEVSSYLLSIFGLQDASKPRSGHSEENFQLASKMDLGDDADLKLEDAKNADDLVSFSQLPMTSILSDYEKQDTSKTGDPGVQRGEVLKCHKCTVTFDGKNDLVHHLISSHNSTANRCKRDTSITDGVIIKDGKYECQFCHKIFDERHRYNGHIGVHVRDYAKSVEALGGVISMQKSSDPAPTGVLPSTSKMHESIGIDGEKTSGVVAIDGLSSGFSHSIIKADNVTENCGDTDGHSLVLLSQDKQTIKADKDDKVLVEEYSDKLDKICNMKMDNLGKVDVATVFANRCNACPVNETAPKNENKSVCESSGETNVLKCIPSGINNCVAESRSSESCSLAPPGNERAIVFENNVIEVSVRSLEEPQLGVGPEIDFLALNGKDKTCSGEDIQDKCLSSTVEDMKVDDGCTFENNESVSGFGNHHSGLKDVNANVKQQCSSEVCSLFPFGNEQRPSLKNDGNEIVSSFMLESLHERGSGSGLCSSSTDEKTCAASNYVNNISTSTWDEPRFDEVNISGNSSITVGFGSNHASQSNEAVTSIKQDGIPIAQWRNPFQGKASKSHVFADEQGPGFDNNLNKVSTDALELLKLDEVKSYEHRYVLKNCEIFNSTTNEHKQIRGSSESGVLSLLDYEQCQVNVNDVNKLSCSSIEESKHKTVNSSWNTELLLAFDTQAGLDVDVASTMQGQSSERCSFVPSGMEQTFSTDNDVTGVYSSTVGELKHERGSKNGFPCQSACDQSENKLNRVYTNTVWDQPRLEDMEKPRDDELMIGFGNHAQSSEDAMAELMWRTNEQNVQQSGLANTSSPLMPSSGYIPNFDVMTGKGGDKIFITNDRFNSTSGLEGLGSSSSIGHLEYNFLTMQGSSHPEESKVLSYDAEMEQGFNSSVWLKKEALPLLPKLASRNQVRTACVWCGNEFYLESENSGMQSDSVGFMCGNCKAKYSGQFNVQ